MKNIILLLALAVICMGHSTFYNVDRNETCYKENKAEIFSWHVHLLYWNKDSKHTAGAYAVRDHFIEDFKEQLGEECTDLFHQPKLCAFEPDYKPAGPFVTAQWAIYATPQDLGALVAWFVQYRDNYDILIHPNTGCELEDHSWWALWSGNPWPIDLSIFSHDQPFPWPEESRHSTYVRQIVGTTTESDLIKKFLQEHEEYSG